MFHFGKTLGYSENEASQLSLLGNLHELVRLQFLRAYWKNVVN